MSSRWSGTGFFFCFFLGDAGALLPLTLSSLLATLHFSEQSIQTHTLSDISHILYPPSPAPTCCISIHTISGAVASHTAYSSICRHFDVTSERAVCNAHYAAVTLYFVRLLSWVRLARFRGRNTPNVSDAFVVDGCGYIDNVIVYIDAR